MNTYRKSPVLKSLAKGQLLGNYGKVIPAVLLHYSTILFLETMTASLFATDALWADIGYYLVMFLISIFSGLFVVAEHYIYLKICCRYPVALSDIFYGFRVSKDQALKIQFLLTALNFICMLPSNVLLQLFQRTNNTLYYMLSCFFMVIGMVIYMFISLKYALVFYLSIDFPQYSVRKLYAMSNEIMKGHKGRLLYIEFSFFPLMLLGLLSLGIGFLWIIPYVNATEANFYLDIMSQRNRNMQQNP